MTARAPLFLVALLLGCSPAAIPPPPAPPPTAAARAPRPPREGSDWSRFLGPNGDASSPETGILTAWPKDGLRKVWEAPLGIGYAPPTVAGGRVYHFDRFGDNSRLTCRDAATGEFAWKFEAPTQYVDQYGFEPGPRACPVVDGDRVYLYDPEGMLFCLSAADGKELWKVDTRDKYRFRQNFFGVASVPVVEGDLLLVAVGGSPAGPRPTDPDEVKGNGTAIVAFDKKTGEQKYALGDELASYATPAVVTVSDRRIGLYFARGGLLGFDPQTGKELFHYPWRARVLESVNASNPVVVGDTVLLTESYEKGSACLKLADGGVKEIWTDAAADRLEKALMGHWCTPVAEGGFVYGSSGRHTNEADLRCVELATGDVKWTERRTTRCTLLKIDGHALSLGENGELRLFKLTPTKYEEAARWEPPDLEYPCWAPPAVSRGLLYVRGKRKLVCYELTP